MNIPLNIDWQQILLHWMNLAILAGGLYFLLYSPVKKFMAQREERYRAREADIAGRLAEAEQLKADYQAKLDGAAEEIHAAQAKAQAAMQRSTEEQLAQAQAQADEILTQARAEADYTKERARRESQREIKDLAAKVAKRLAARAQEDQFEQFLNQAEAQQAEADQQGGAAHGKN